MLCMKHEVWNMYAITIVSADIGYWHRDWSIYNNRMAWWFFIGGCIRMNALIHGFVCMYVRRLCECYRCAIIAIMYKYVSSHSICRLFVISIVPSLLFRHRHTHKETHAHARQSASTVILRSEHWVYNVIHTCHWSGYLFNRPHMFYATKSFLLWLFISALFSTHKISHSRLVFMHLSCFNIQIEIK